MYSHGVPTPVICPILVTEVRHIEGMQIICLCVKVVVNQ